MEFKAGNYSIDFVDGNILTESQVYCYIQRIHSREEDFEDGDIGKRIERYDRYICKIIPLSKIEYEDMYYHDEDLVNEYANMNTDCPPILVSKSGSKYVIEDGMHRCMAMALKAETMESKLDDEGLFCKIEPLMCCFVPYSKRGKILKSN